MTQYKMVVLDMDDTLMNSDNKLSIETKSYLLDIQKAWLLCGIGLR